MPEELPRRAKSLRVNVQASSLFLMLYISSERLHMFENLLSDLQQYSSESGSMH